MTCSGGGWAVIVVVVGEGMGSVGIESVATEEDEEARLLPPALPSGFLVDFCDMRALIFESAFILSFHIVQRLSCQQVVVSCPSWGKLSDDNERDSVVLECRTGAPLVGIATEGFR